MTRLSLFVAMASVLVSTSAFSRGPMTSFGLQAGLNFSNADLAAPASSNSVTGFMGGPYLESSLIPGLLYFQPELNFIQKGANNSAFGTAGTTRLNYLEIPVLAKVKLDFSVVRIFALAGPSAALLLGSSGPGSTSNRLSSLDVGFKLGVGIALPTGDISEVTLSVRKAFSVTTIDTLSQWKSNGIEVLLGYLF